MSEMVKGRNDSILGVIRITIWILWIHFDEIFKICLKRQNEEMIQFLE